jgi:polysaccharide biosynthesis protein PslG
LDSPCPLRFHTPRRPRRWLALLLTLVGALAVAPGAHAAITPPAEIAGVAMHPWRLNDESKPSFWSLIDPGLRDASFAKLESAGVRFARVDFRWDRIEGQAKEIRDWTEFDAIVAAATAHHVQLLPMVAFTPSWANSNASVWTYPNDPRDFQDFMAAALARYPDIPAWEIWNEPNLAQFSQPRPDVGKFAGMLAAADAARRSVGSHASLVSGGLSATGDAHDFFEEMARDGAFDHVDGFGIHPYSYSTTPPDGRGSNFLELPWYHRRLVQLGRPNVGVWITEFGAPSAVAANVYGPPLSEDQQASQLGSAFALAAGWPWVRELSWYEFQEECPDAIDPECKFGLLRPDFSEKPAFGALRGVVAGHLPSLGSQTIASVARVHPQAARTRRKRGRARRKPGRALTFTVNGSVATPGDDPAGESVSVTLSGTARAGRRSRSVTRTLSTRIGADGRYTLPLGSLERGTWTVKARFGGTSRYAPSSSPALLLRVAGAGKRRSQAR